MGSRASSQIHRRLVFVLIASFTEKIDRETEESNFHWNLVHSLYQVYSAYREKVSIHRKIDQDIFSFKIALIFDFEVVAKNDVGDNMALCHSLHIVGLSSGEF